MLGIDGIIFILFLIINLWLGLTSSKGISTLKEYAVGNGTFSTAVIAFTLISTWVGGNFLTIIVTETYYNGLFSIICCIGEFLLFLLIGWFFAPRLSEFIGKVSIADAMTYLYGKKVGFITSIAGFIGVSGLIAVQLKISGLIFNIALGLDEIWGVLISGIIITVYSSLGGIKSVTFTDTIQFFTFGTIIPLITFYLWYGIHNFDQVIDAVNQHQFFDLNNIFSTSDKSIRYLFLWFYYVIPTFNPAVFQRVVIAKNWMQIRRSFYISAGIIFILSLMTSWIGVILFTKYPNLHSNEILKALIFNQDFPPIFKGLLLVSIMAMIMSTADSYINSSAVLITHDFFKSMSIKIKNELLSARIVSALIGGFAILVSLKQDNLLEIILFTTSFYMPIVTVPFLMAICGYRTPFESAVLGGMTAGLITVLLWNYYQITVVDSIIPAMVANLLTLVIMHYYYLEKRSNRVIP